MNHLKCKKSIRLINTLSMTDIDWYILHSVQSKPMEYRVIERVLKLHVKWWYCCFDNDLQLCGCVYMPVRMGIGQRKKEQSIERRSSMHCIASHRIASQHITYTFYYCPLDCKSSFSYSYFVSFSWKKILLEGTWEYFDKKKSLSNSCQKKKKKEIWE